MKKFLSFLLAAMLVLGMVATANASDVAPAADQTFTITINNSMDGHIYEAYQVFSGTLAKYEPPSPEAEEKSNGERYILGNIEWGTGIDTAKIPPALWEKYGLNDAADQTAEKLAEKLAAGTVDAKEFAALIALALKNSTDYVSVAGYDVYTISNVPAGYYLIKDKNDTLDGKNDAYSRYMMNVVQNVTANPKSSVPTSQKKVKDVCDSNATINDSTSNVGWNDSADHDIGDMVPFQLKGTIAENYSDFKTYKLVFKDVQDPGFDAPANYKAYAVDPVTDNQTPLEAITDYVVELGEDGNDFTVTFANLKNNEAIGNSYEIFFEYESRLNKKAVIGPDGNPNVMTMEFSNNPNWVATGTDTEEPTGETPKDKVKVFTYELKINKVDDTGASLEGAKFTLSKKASATSNNYIPVENAIVTLGPNEENPTTFTFTGLDDGTYKLVETETPDGYNTMEDIIFQIQAYHESESVDPQLGEKGKTPLAGVVKSGDSSIKPNQSTGAFTITGNKTLEANIVNLHGAMLPSTGGIGTTIFYLLGSIMFIGAAMTLVVRRRADAEEV